jgi:hypothetical protein
MTQATTQSNADAAMDDRVYQAMLDRLATEPLLAPDNITLSPSDGASLGRVLLGAGAVGLALTVVGGFVLEFRPAFAAFEIGVFTATAMSVGALFFVLLFHITNAAWSTTMRRQFENVASLLPLCMAMVALIVIAEVVTGGTLLRWMGIEPGDHLMDHKDGYLNTTFFVIRFLIYAGIWSFLALRMRGWSTEQDRSGDRWLSRRMRFNSGWGILAMALTTAFFSFDFLMGMDFRFYSTMWGVYFFAASAFSSTALLAIIFAWLLSKKKLQGVVTSEHTHDLGKLMFAFTVFWGYIAFGQYFLIWYANIPEETMFFIFRRDEPWMLLGKVLIVMHFLIPFFLLISRVPKRNPPLLAAIGVLMILAHAIDMTYIIQPMVDANETDLVGLSSWWVILSGLVGVLGVYGFFLVRRITSVSLTSTKDPRLVTALEHKNYV